MKKILLFLITTIFNVNAFSQKSPDILIDQFATNLAEVSADTAVTQLFSTNQWMFRNLNATDQVSRQLSNTLPLIGNFIGKELITKKTSRYKFSFI